jgi:ribosomal protein S24E
MDITIERDEENPLLERRDIEAVINHEQDATPSETVARKELGKALTVDPETVAIDTINTGYGTNTARITAKVFDEPVKPLRPDTEEAEGEEEE